MVGKMGSRLEEIADGAPIGERSSRYLLGQQATMSTTRQKAMMVAAIQMSITTMVTVVPMQQVRKFKSLVHALDLVEERRMLEHG
ncbi:hypothetical protein HPB52_014053 [Rhipicephalus sanguineus]|uniref:Uncharacterized protein n=1 Tax=Rhipicephalus sanguineus TaxID=34632 RepID=A0A9D4Q0B1_RHISA|nr:hypothetical protein HPB52_014053 [Rhipicephalus sanguineus]